MQLHGMDHCKSARCKWFMHVSSMSQASVAQKDDKVFLVTNRKQVLCIINGENPKAKMLDYGYIEILEGIT